MTSWAFFMHEKVYHATRCGHILYVQSGQKMKKLTINNFF